MLPYARLKEEATEQKKADEKAKRDAIFQEYLRKKAEREVAEEESKAGISGPSSAVQRRLKNKAKGPRPKSQPPGGTTAPGVTEDGNSHSSQSHSSQEDLHTRGRSPGPELVKSELCCYGLYKRQRFKPVCPAVLF